jgi:mono/diheme cytochrome c family protein
MIGLPLLVALAAAGMWSFEGTAPTLRADDVAVVASGERVYASHCAACHGIRLEGQPNWRTRDASGRMPAPPHDESGHTWHHDDRTLFKIVKLGVGEMIGDRNYQSNMPVYGGQLSDAEIVAVLSYIKRQWPEAIRQKHDALNAGNLR